MFTTQQTKMKGDHAHMIIASRHAIHKRPDTNPNPREYIDEKSQVVDIRFDSFFLKKIKKYDIIYIENLRRKR